MLNHILAGTFNSLILGEARMKGWIYWFNAWTEAWAGSSTWVMKGAVNYDKLPEVFGLIGRVLKQVRAGEIADEMIEAAKNYQLGKFQMREPTAMGLAYYYLDKYRTLGGIRPWEIEPLMRKFAKERMVAVADELLSSEIRVLGGVGNYTQAELNKLWRMVK
jgi:hypothetical protein